MKFWWSGEIQGDVFDPYLKAMNTIEVEINRLLSEISFDDKVQEWDFIAIIREEDSPIYAEVVRKASRGKSLEFRLKIPYADFLPANARNRVRLIFQALFRSVDLMKKLGVSSETQTALRTILARAEKEIASTSFVN